MALNILVYELVDEAWENHPMIQKKRRAPKVANEATTWLSVSDEIHMPSAIKLRTMRTSPR